MRDSNTAFYPVTIKQEPRDPVDQDASSSSTATTTPTSPNIDHHHHHHNNNNNTNGQAWGAVDLSSAPGPSRTVEVERGRNGSSDGRAPYDSTEHFVAQIAKRVREESGLASVELTPVTGLGPLADLKATGHPLFTGPSSVEGGGKSRGEYACAECSSRFDTARDYRAHCLTHQVLRAESRLRSSRGKTGEVEGLDGGGEDGEGVFGGLGVGVVDGTLTFTCEDCDTRFSSRDTYAMHMLIRAKNESCFPGRPVLPPQVAPPLSSSSSSTTTPTADTTTPMLINNKYSAENNNSSNNLPPSSPSASSAGPSLLLATATPSDLKHEPGSKNEADRRCNGGRGESRGHGLAGGDNTTPVPPHHQYHQFFRSLGLELDYSASWWSKYMPWMMTGVGMGMGVVGGGNAGGGEREAPSMPLVCYLCGELFSNRDSLAMHVLFHTRDLPSSDSSIATSSSWGKPLPSLASLPGQLTPSPSSSSALLGQAAMRQLQQQRVHYHHNTATTNNSNASNYEQRRFSPTEAAVASAAAAAMAAVGASTPGSGAVQGVNPPNLSSDKADMTTPVKGGASRDWQPPTSPRGGAKSHDWIQAGRSQGGGHFNLTLPQRGSSAPLTAPTTPTSPLPSGSESQNPRNALVRARPLSADHVVLRPLAKNAGEDAKLSATDLNRPSAWGPDVHSSKSEEGWHGGADSQLQQTSAFNVYRLQRIKKLRLAKTVYRRPGARGRPPMTIYGTTGRRPTGANVPTLALTSSPCDSVPTPQSSNPNSSCTFSFSSKVTSMVQALTSQGHAVSACGHCELVFGDRTLYQLHMGLHNVNNPWQCNACGCVCSGRLHFATHTLHY